MPLPFIPTGPTFAITPARTAFGTVVTALIPPFPGPKSGAPLVYGLVGGQPNWIAGLYTRIVSMPITCGATINAITILRPLNWTTIKTAMPKNTTAITLTDDPGVYSTNYRYPIPGQQFIAPGTTNPTPPALVTDAAISSANKWVAYQMDDGVWQLDTIASGTFAGGNLVLTTGTPNRTGATVAAGRPLFYFGTTTLSDPRTGQAHLQIDPVVSTTADLLGASGFGIESLNPGDPIMIHNPNATATTSFEGVFGDYKAY